eukprot:1157317-Pelagomonas_calceolata.AAC.7
MRAQPYQMSRMMDKVLKMDIDALGICAGKVTQPQRSLDEGTGGCRASRSGKEVMELQGA